jgi:small conductance mechanosensitive channel
MVFADLWPNVQNWLLTHGLRILLLVVGTLILVKVVRTLSRKVEGAIEKQEGIGAIERKKRARSIERIVRNTALAAILAVASMMILRETGVEIGPIIAGAGIAGLAIGFGAQSLVKDVISGFFILVENHFGVGDVISAAGVAGLVESMTLRVTVLRDLEGKVHIIPNSEIGVVTNMTKEWSRFMMDVGVAYKEDIDFVNEVIAEVGADLRNDPEFGSFILEDLQILGVDAFEDSQVSIRILIKTLPLKQWQVGREYRKRLKKAFDQKGIEIPFPHRTVYMGEGENTGKLVVEKLHPQA